MIDTPIFSRPVTVALDIAAWALIHGSTGYLVHRVHAEWLDRDHWLFREWRLDRDGAFYVRVLRIKRWKKWLPEAGAIFEGGFNKRSLSDVGDDYLRVYGRETRRAELGHWLAAAFAPLFFLWNPWAVGILMSSTPPSRMAPASPRSGITASALAACLLVEHIVEDLPEFPCPPGLVARVGRAAYPFGQRHGRIGGWVR